jgi:hypothetical protein
VIAAALKLNVVGASLTDLVGVWVGAGSHFDLLTCHLGWMHSLLFNRRRSDWVGVLTPGSPFGSPLLRG